MARISDQKLFDKIQEEVDNLTRHDEDMPDEAELSLTITLAEARYLTELLGRYNVPELLKE